MTSCAGSSSTWQDGSVWKEDEHSKADLGRWDRTEIKEDREPQRWEDEDEE